MRKIAGFTLVELLIVVLVLGVLTIIAVPMYQNYTKRAACEAGKTGLMQVDNLVNEYFLKHGHYNNSDMASFPITQIPDSGKANFSVAISNVTASTYKITATVNATGALANYAGATLSIDNKGDKTATAGLANVWTQGCSALQ